MCTISMHMTKIWPYDSKIYSLETRRALTTSFKLKDLCLYELNFEIRRKTNYNDQNRICQKKDEIDFLRQVLAIYQVTMISHTIEKD